MDSLNLWQVSNYIYAYGDKSFKANVAHLIMLYDILCLTKQLYFLQLPLS